MKYLKTYENSTKTIEIGYYVIGDIENRADYIRDYLKTHIGKVVYIDNSAPVLYMIQYVDLPHFFYGDVTNVENRISLFFDEILYSSKNKEELEAMIAANKYNL